MKKQGLTISFHGRAGVVTGSKHLLCRGNPHGINSSHLSMLLLINLGLKCIDAAKVKHTFLVHGETTELVEMKSKLKIDGYQHVHIPVHGESFDIYQAIYLFLLENVLGKILFELCLSNRAA
jgi:hypothetical protein